MSVNERNSVSSAIPVTREYSQNTKDAHDTVEWGDSCKALNHKLSLEFRCSETPQDQRLLCENFWKSIDEHPELNRIMASGWADKNMIEKEKLIKKKTPPPSHCDQLQEFLDHNVDKFLLLGLKELTRTCSTDLTLNKSSANLMQGLQNFDSRVKPEISIPPSKQ